MRILFLIARPDIRGPLPKIGSVIASELVRLGCGVETSPWSRHTEHESLAEKLFGRLKDVLNVRRKLRNGCFDVMVVTTTHDWMALIRDLPLLFVARPLCTKIVLQYHGSHCELLVGPGHRLMKLFTQEVLRRADAILVLSTEEQRQWKAFYPSIDCRVVSNPFRPLGERAAAARTQPAGSPAPRLRLLFVGRLIAAKGVYELLGAMPMVLQSSDCSLVIAGDGPERANLIQMIQKRGLQEQVQLVGYLGGDELLAAYRGADLFVLPTYHCEGFPTVVAEAMSEGLPIVTTAVRGAADHLRERDNALFVPAKDPSALAGAILELINDPQLRRAMGAANRQKVQDFAPELVAQSYMDVLKDIVCPE